MVVCPAETIAAERQPADGRLAIAERKADADGGAAAEVFVDAEGVAGVLAELLLLELLQPTRTNKVTPAAKTALQVGADLRGARCVVRIN